MTRTTSVPSKTARSSANIQQMADRLHSAAIHLLRKLRRVDEITGLTAPKLSALSVIVYAGPISLGELAAAEQVRPPTMTHLIRDLQKARLVRTKTDRNDRRITRVEATFQGISLLKKGRSRRVRLLAEWLATLNDSDYVALQNAAEILETFVRPQNSAPR
jgi:DNA-binding MarR family transcriptional regulator